MHVRMNLLHSAFTPLLVSTITTLDICHHYQHKSNSHRDEDANDVGVVTPNSISRNYSHSLFGVHVPDNRIGAAGATALVEGLKKMRELKTLNLEREFRVVIISRCGDSGTEMV